MELNILTAISPIDGRYRGKAEPFAGYFSEFALIKYRVFVEIEYFIALCELPIPQLSGVDKAIFPRLREIYKNFTLEDATRVKNIEKVTNHDVKAVEYFIKEQFDAIGGLDAFKEFIHFGLTSQDINNTSVPCSIKDALNDVYYPAVEENRSSRLRALDIFTQSGDGLVTRFSTREVVLSSNAIHFSKGCYAYGKLKTAESGNVENNFHVVPIKIYGIKGA